MTPDFPFTGTGILRYSKGSEGPKLVAEVDQGMVDFARALVPPSVRLNPQRYAPHITIVRKESPPRPTLWGRREGDLFCFEYDPRVVPGEVYYWLRVRCPFLNEVREELGLPPMSVWNRPPDNEDCFHITIGNLKGVRPWPFR